MTLEGHGAACVEQIPAIMWHSDGIIRLVPVLPPRCPGAWRTGMRCGATARPPHCLVGPPVACGVIGAGCG